MYVGDAARYRDLLKKQTSHSSQSVKTQPLILPNLRLGRMREVVFYTVSLCSALY